MKVVVKEKVIKWVDVGVIYPISDSAWVNPNQVVSKIWGGRDGGMKVVTNKRNELILIMTITSSRGCIDYKWLNDATKQKTSSLSMLSI